MDLIPLDHLPPPVSRLTRHYVLYDDGTLGMIEQNGQEPPRLAKRGRFVTEAEYTAQRHLWEIARADHVQALQEQDEERHRADFLALVEAGIPEETARRLSGYTGPWPLPEVV